MAKAPESTPLVDKESLAVLSVEDPDFVPEIPEKEEDLDNFALKYTTTDAAILACSRLKHSDKMLSRDVAGFAATIMLQIGCQVIQFLLLYLMLKGSVEGMEDPYEPAQFSAQKNALTEAITGKHIMGAFPNNSTLQQAVAVYTNTNCKANTSPIGVHFIFLVLWFGISWEAVSTTCHRYIVLLKIPAVDLDANMDTNSFVDLGSAPVEGNHDITHLSFPWKLFVGIFILLPHTFCVLFLVWTGTKLQAFAPNVLTQSKASLKLGIITTLSSTMMVYFGCGHMKKYMGVDEENKDTPVAVNYRIAKSSGTPTGLAVGGQAWKTWGETVVKVVLGLIFCIVVVYVWFDEMDTFNNMCAQYYEMLGCSDPRGTGLSVAVKGICPQRPVQDWFPGFDSAKAAA